MLRYGIFILMLGLLFGCVEVPPPAKDISKEIPIPDITPPVQENIPSADNTDTEKSPASPSFASTAPEEALLNSFPDDTTSPNNPYNFIDRVYAMDLETYKPPNGRALTADRHYELIAENEQPFVDYVSFTVLADGEAIASFKATCPESCANEKMYSVSFLVPRGDFQEIKIIAEDGSGAKGESVIYQYAASKEEASYLAESCSVSSAVPPSQCAQGSQNLVYYGSTISTGWPEGTTAQPYNLNSSSYHDICGEVNGGGGLGTGFLAQTRCFFSYTFCWSLKTKIDKEACTCECWAQPADVAVKTSINIDFPNWAGYDQSSICEQQEWDDFLKNTKTHEEGHVENCKWTQKAIQHDLGSSARGAVGATCDLACGAAIERGNAATDSIFQNDIDNLNDEQKAYDQKTSHGATQGAVLDCAACG